MSSVALYKIENSITALVDSVLYAQRRYAECATGVPRKTTLLNDLMSLDIKLRALTVKRDILIREERDGE